MPHPPSVDKLARSIKSPALPQPLAVQVAREAIAADRVDELPALARQRTRAMLTPVINATGTLLHTNLGRAPFGVDIAAGYTNLELNIESGKRGSRQRAVGDLLATACGAEAAMVVNNCAGAVLLTLAALGTGRGVAVSRGEMVEIGGGFRIPDVMAQSGAELIEVGTTNRTRVADYAKAVQQHDDVAMLLKVHRSNYEIVGFTEEASIADLATLETPVVADIGSGLLDASCPWLAGPPPSWAGQRTGGPPNARRRRRPRAVQRRQTLRRPPGWNHCWRPGARGTLRETPPRSSATPRRPRLASHPRDHVGLPRSPRNRHSVLGNGGPNRRPARSPSNATGGRSWQ